MLQIAAAAVLAAATACSPAPMRWERTGVADPAEDERTCRTAAREEAARQLPYGYGPPLIGGYRHVSMIQWVQAIDNQRTFVAEDLTGMCMRERGFVRVPG